jgi:hypothetical protein
MKHSYNLDLVGANWNVYAKSKLVAIHPFRAGLLENVRGLCAVFHSDAVKVSFDEM